MKIISLLENTTNRQDLSVEHGLSLYIEANGQKILFDMGQTDMFAKNASKLGVDLSKVDFAVVSHGHNDHGGGLNEFLCINKSAPVYIQSSAFNPRYNAQGGFIGLDDRFAHCDRIIMVEDELSLCGGIKLYSCNSFERSEPFADFGFTQDGEGGRVVDDFSHEQHLVINEGGKLVVISGCSHKGIVQISRWFNPDVVVGGFHFAKITDFEWLAKAAAELDAFKAVYYTCHCTGNAQYEFMKERMKKLNYLACGQSVEI